MDKEATTHLYRSDNFGVFFFADFGGFLSILAVTTAKYFMVFKHELKGRLKEVEMLQLRHLKQ